MDSDSSESTISKSVKFNISGGNIVRNTAVTGNGGGIWLKSAYGNMRFTMSGGRISNNVASKNGGGVYISEPYYGKFTVSICVSVSAETDEYASAHLFHGGRTSDGVPHVALRIVMIIN